MKKRQHRCPYYLLKLNKKDYDEFQTKKIFYDDLIEKYQTQINIYSNKIMEYESIINQIFNIIKPVSQYKEPKSLIKCIEDAYLSKSTKENALILIKKYINFCNEKMNSKIESIDNNVDDLNIPSLYDPENAYEFVTTKKPPYNRTTIKKHLNTLLRLLKISTNNPYLEYSLPIGNKESTKLKHLLTKKEIKAFIKYLNDTKHYIAILIIMLLYKFGVRIGAISKIKCNDLNKDNIIIFKEKNNIIIKRILLNETSLLIRRLIKECNLNDNDYLFYNFKFNNDEYKRTKYFSKKIRDLMIISNSFSPSTIETISAHAFRVYHAVETFEGKGLKSAQEELGHKNIITTYNSYVKPEIRNLNIREEKSSLLLNKGKVVKIRNKVNSKNSNDVNSQFLDEQKYNIEEIDSINLSEEGQDIIDDDFHINENIFYFDGHFYDDIDFIENKYLLMKNNLEEKEINKDIYIGNDNNNSIIIQEKEINKNHNNKSNFFFNTLKNKNNFKNDKESFKIIGQKNDFLFSTEIICKDDDIISLSKVKKKKECFYLSQEDESTLLKTINLNNEGIFYNIKIEINNNQIYVKAAEDIGKNILITIIGGKIFYYNEFLKNKIEKQYLRAPIILYFQTANKLYDRIISINPINLAAFLFHNTNKKKENLDIKKMINKYDKIILCVITKEYIKKGEILLLNRDSLFNHYLNHS